MHKRKFKLFNYVVEFGSAKCKWTHFKIHQHSTYSHLVWGKFSVIYGQPHLTEVWVCSDCWNEVETKSWGDESLTWCENCQTLEGNTKYVTQEMYEGYHAC